MAKIGDTVRFLNTTGGGRITRMEGHMAYVEDEDGFETPVLIKELVVVLPAGHEAKANGPKVMFDQKAFDEGRKATVQPEPVAKENVHAPEPEPPVEETSHGESPTVVLAFEPTDVKHLDKSLFGAVLVNDSNYWLDYTFARRGSSDRGWTLVARGTVAPNELADLVSLTHRDLPGYERVSLQCTASKRDKPYTLQPPVSVSRKLDLTKFHKYHCFRPGVYFDTPVIEVTLVKDGNVSHPMEVNASEVREAMSAKGKGGDLAAQLAGKYRVDRKQARPSQNPADNPRRVLPLIEVDLHIAELVDSTAGMEPKDMLMLQLDTARRVLKENGSRVGQKIVFIHGKGDGVLRKELLAMLRKEFGRAEIQDASFQEYGFGATLVTLR